MRETIKKHASKFAGVVTGVIATVGGAITAFAEGTSSVADQMVDAVGTGASQASSSIVSMLGTVAPIIIGIVVGVAVLTAGIAWVKKIRSNSK